MFAESSPRPIDKKEVNNQESEWTPGDYNFVEDVPGWDKQLLYLDISAAIEDLSVETDLRFTPEELEDAQAYAKKFNDWFQERVQYLSPGDRREVLDIFSDNPAEVVLSVKDERDENGKVIESNVVKSSEPYRINFKYYPRTRDYKDIMKYEYREADNSDKEDESGERKNKWWPKGLLPRKNRVEE